MKKHVIEGPGGTRTLPFGIPEADREFKAALNTDEALHWAFHYPGTHQSRLAKVWMKQNFGTDNVDKVRKMLAKKNNGSKSWQDNPLLYAVIIVTLTVSGGVATKYFSQFIPADVPSSTVMQAPSSAVITEEDTTGKKGRFHLPRWLTFRKKQKD